MRESNRKAMFARMNGKGFSIKNAFSDFFVRPTNSDLIANHRLGIGYQGSEMSLDPKKKKR